jgi:hypothetical protein
VKIRLRIPFGDPPDDDHPHRRTPPPRPAPASSGTAPVSTQDRLRSLHAQRMGQVNVNLRRDRMGPQPPSTCPAPGAPGIAPDPRPVQRVPGPQLVAPRRFERPNTGGADSPTAWLVSPVRLNIRCEVRSSGSQPSWAWRIRRACRAQGRVHLFSAAALRHWAQAIPGCGSRRR